ncbi:MAG: hypothetical protein ACKN9V_02970, partial [Pseudomonadota bacterium]
SQLEKDNPSVFVALLKNAFKTLVERQNQTEEWLTILREYEPEDRFIQFIYRQSLKSKESTPQGKVISVQPSLLAFHLNTGETIIKTWLDSLVSSGLISPKSEHSYFVPDENKLLSFDRTWLDVQKPAA